MTLFLVESAGGFFSWLLHTSWQAAVLAAMILIIQRVFSRHLSPSWSFALWLLLVAKLLLPFAPSSRLSLFNYLSPENWTFWNETRDQIGMGVSDWQILPDGQSAGTTVQGPVRLTPLLVATMVWAFVAGLLSLKLIRANTRLLSHSRKTRPVVDSALLSLLEDCKAELRVYVPVSLVLTEKVSSPALLGFLRPRLLLPANMLESLTEAELRHVFLHELAHLKRSDVFLNWTIAFLQIAHWFNPVLWIAFNRMRSDLEIACDGLVLGRPASNERAEYGATIIKVLELATRSGALPGTVGILENKSDMRRRIRRIGQSQPHARWSLLPLILLVLLACTTLTSGRSLTTHLKSQTKTRGVDMNALPEVERITLPNEIIAVCREYYGPYEQAPAYVTDVQKYLEAQQIPYLAFNAFGVYFDDPNQKKPEELRSYQGVLVEQEVEVKPPYFVYKMKQKEYLHTTASPQEALPTAYLALFNYMGLHHVRALPGGHQHVTMKDGQVVFDIYLEIDE